MKFLAESRRLLICAIPSRYYRISVTELLEIPIEIHCGIAYTIVQDFVRAPRDLGGGKKIPGKDRERRRRRGGSKERDLRFSFHFVFLFQVVLLSLDVPLPVFVPFSSIYVILSPPTSVRLYVRLSFHLTSYHCPLVYFPFPIVGTTAQDTIKEPGLARKKMTPVGIMESSRRPRGCVRGLHRGVC